MLKRILAFSLCGLLGLLVLPACWPPARAAAQGKKPSQVLKQMTEQQAKLLEKFDDDVREGRAQLYEWESRADSLRQATAESAAGFKVADWKGDELLALAALYQAAENFPAAIEAYRAYLKEDAKSRKAADAQLSLARALIEAEQFAEAEKVLAGMHFARTPFRDAPQLTTVKLGLYKDLTLAWRDLGQSERAVMHAKEGFNLAGPAIQDRLNEVAQRDRLTLAALFVALTEGLGRKKEAEDFQKQFINDDLKDQPPMRSFYEAELASARLFGKPAPELVAARWLGDAAKPLAASRGKVVLLNFWATWCGPCKVEIPAFVELYDQYKDKGLMSLGVSIEDTVEQLRPFMKEYRMQYPVLQMTPDIETAYGPFYGVPMTFFIARDGTICRRHMGPATKQQFEQEIKALL